MFKQWVLVSKVFILLVAGLLLSGCMAAVLAPAAPLIGGLMGDNSSVTIQEETIDPQFRAMLPGVQKFAFMSVDPTAIHAAQHMERNSTYLVSVVAPPEAASPSQAKRYMETVCKGEEKPDVVLYWQTPTSNAGTGTTMKGVLTGRVSLDLTLATDVLRCDDQWRSQFTTVGSIRSGAYNQDQSKLAEILGGEFSTALLRLAGKLPAAEGT